jgi:hypothetical protein
MSQVSITVRVERDKELVHISLTNRVQRLAPETDPQANVKRSVEHQNDLANVGRESATIRPIGGCC